MNISELMPIIKEVLLNPFVIGTAIVIILYCSFMGYIARYKKKPARPKKKKIQPEPTPAPKQESDEEQESEESVEE